MKKLDKSNLLKWGLPFVLILIALNAIAIFTLRFDKGIYSQRREDLALLRELTSNIMKNAANFDMQSRSFVLIQDKRFEDTSKNCLKKHKTDFAKMDSLFNTLDYRPQKFTQLKDSVYEYYDFIFPIFNLARQGKQNDVIDILNKERGVALWHNVSDFRKPVYKVVDKEIALIEARQNTLIFLNTALQSILAILGIPVLIFVILTLRRNETRNKSLLAGLQQKNKELIFNIDVNTKDKQNLSIDDVVGRITENLEKSHHFIEQITEGNYDVEWEGRNAANNEANKNNLSGKLVLMRDQMKKARIENESRAWFNQSIGKLTELLRGKKRSDNLNLDEVLTFLIKSINANIGSIFIAEEIGEEKELTLKASYAYDRKKFIKKRVKAGEGLIGQAYLEKEIVRLRKLPAGYINIVSGLGNAEPSELVVLPLLNHEEVVGMLEIASLNTLEEHQISFLLKTSEIIASSLSFQRNSSITQKLLEESQILTENLRTSEEELKQNLEEMQATSEEAARRYKELYQENEYLKEQLQKE